MSQLSRSVQSLKDEGFVQTQKVITGITKDIVIGVTWTKGGQVYHQFPTAENALLEVGEATTC